jgi:hypothetical protein
VCFILLSSFLTVISYTNCDNFSLFYHVQGSDRERAENQQQLLLIQESERGEEGMGRGNRKRKKRKFFDDSTNGEGGGESDEKEEGEEWDKTSSASALTNRFEKRCVSPLQKSNRKIIRYLSKLLYRYFL